MTQTLRSLKAFFARRIYRQQSMKRAANLGFSATLGSIFGIASGALLQKVWNAYKRSENSEQNDQTNTP